MGPVTQQPGEHHTAVAGVPVTDQEVRVLAALATGITSEAAARGLGISARPVRRRVRQVCDRVGVDTTVEVVTWAARRGLV